MAGWWMPKDQLLILRRMAAGEILLQTPRGYQWADGTKCTVSARALHRKSYICGREMRGFHGVLLASLRMEITPTGRNEMGYNRGRNLEAE